MMGSQEQLFEMIFEHTPLGMFTLDRRGYFLRVNRQFCAMVGYSRGDIIDRIGSYQNLIVDGNNEDLQELHELQDVTGLAQEPPPLGTNNKLIRHLRCQGGQELAVHLTLMGLGQAPQEPNINDGLGDLIWGIIEHHGTDDLGDQTLADNLPQYIYRLDLEGKLTYGNRAFLDSIGLNLTTAMGKTYAELYPPAIADRYQTLYRQTIEQGEPKETVEAYPRNGDGDYHQMKLTNIPLKNEQQQIIGMQGIFWDISKIKQTEKILRQQLKREIFLSGITERIRKSLNLEEILTTSVGDIREILEVDRVIICSALPENLGICHQESVKPPWPSMKGQTLPLTNLDDGQNQSYHHGQMGIVEDTTATAWPLDYAAFVEEYQIKAEMTAPHLVGDKLWGLLMAHQCGQTRSWHPFEIDLLQQLATQTAIAIHQSQLYETTKQQAQREKLLNEVIESIRHSLSLHKILPRAAQAILNAFSAKLTLVGICDCKQKTLQTFVTAVPPTQQDMPNEVLATIHDFYLKDIYTSDQILALSNLQELNPPPSPELRAQLHQYELGSVLAIAIKFESEVCGVLSIYHHDGYRWSENDEILIKELANQLAVAIQQGQLYAQLQEANAELKKQVSLDGLTQVANRRRFDQFFNQEWRRCSREEQSLSLILGDIDHFKLFNDNYGHQEGDRCLKEVAQTLEACIKRPGDLVARYGGEEFVIVLPNTTKEGAIHFAQTIRQAIHHLNVPHHYSLTSDRVTMSLGLSSVVPTPGANYLDFLACVDQALYSAKHQGRDRSVFHYFYTIKQ